MEFHLILIKIKCRIVEFLGYSAEDLIGRSAYEFHHVLDHDAIMKSYKTSNANCDFASFEL